jgi:hypothetical protein
MLVLVLQLPDRVLVRNSMSDCIICMRWSVLWCR